MPRPPHFRGDVQGLRAIAVLTVIAAHAGMGLFGGGFVGVDVFFVISGFLISDLLFREVATSGRISLTAFYARRARRILPAATVVILATVAATLMWASALSALDVIRDAWWATFFLFNVHAAQVGTDYFAQGDGPSPLQHYWSLSVEEQFYVVWPVVLLAGVLVARALRKARTTSEAADARPRRLPKLALFWAVAVGTLASFGYGVWLTYVNPTAAYFSTPARAWELGVGALAALVARPVARRLTTTHRAVVCSGGLSLILIAVVGYDSSTAFPGLAAVVPVVGAAMVLVAGAGHHAHEPLPIRLLGMRPLRAVGDWSYSLYLWHWPLLVLPLLMGHQLNSAETFTLVLAAFVLAWLTYRFVETPFRNPLRLPQWRSLVLYPGSVAAVAALCVGSQTYATAHLTGTGDAITITNSSVAQSGTPVSKNDTVALVQASVYAADEGHAIPRVLNPPLLDVRDDIPGLGACDYSDPGVRELCARGDVDGDKTLVVLGNSHGRMWIPAFEKIAEQAGYRAYYFVKSNCTAADIMTGGAYTYDAFEPWTECADWREWAFQQIEALQPDLAVVSTSGPNRNIYTDDGATVVRGDANRIPLTEQAFTDTFTRLEASSDQVALIRDVPKNADNPLNCLTAPNATLKGCMFTPQPDQELDAAASMRAAHATGVTAIDPTPWLCWRNTCPAVIGDTLPYRDQGHLSASYAASLSDLISQRLGIPIDA